MFRHDPNDVFKERKCKDCGVRFTITYGEYHFYADNELDLPKRCQMCRDRRRFEKEMLELEQSARQEIIDRAIARERKFTKIWIFILVYDFLLCALFIWFELGFKVISISIIVFILTLVIGIVIKKRL